MIDEIRAELLRHVRGSGRGLLDLVAEHAALIVEIGAAVRDALQGLRDTNGRAQAERLASRAKAWESDADRLHNQVRAAGAASGDARFVKTFVEQADNVADDLEDAAFFVTLLEPSSELTPILEALIDLGNQLTTGTQELVKALSTWRSGAPGAAREDTVDFLEAVHRIAGVEHEAPRPEVQQVALRIEWHHRDDVARGRETDGLIELARQEALEDRVAHRLTHAGCEGKARRTGDA